MAEMALMSQYMQPDNSSTTTTKKGIGALMNNFIDSNRQLARISVNMKDIGSKQLPLLINDFDKKGKKFLTQTNTISHLQVAV